jgi:hypothetical protein
MIRRAFVQASLVVGVMFWFITSGVHAQNCPEGMVPEGGQGVASCAPAGNSSQPQGHWVNRWGAIATDVPNQGVGASFNQSSEEQAEQSAIANCLSNRGVSCKVEQTYFNSCIAMVVSDKSGAYVIAVDKTEDKAAQRGIKSCSAGGDTTCRARYTSCSTAQWAQ